MAVNWNIIDKRGKKGRKPFFRVSREIEREKAYHIVYQSKNYIIFTFKGEP